MYGVPRATFDLDILIEATSKNVRKLLDALIEAGLYTASITSVAQVLAAEVTIFKDLVRIDVQTSTPGLDFKKAWKNKKTMQYRTIDFYVVSKEDLIASKKAAGREKDLADVRLLLTEAQDNDEGIK